MDRNTSAPGARTQAHGFSLVELLVVIGIISLLIGIALPAFSRAKEAAKVTTTTATINAIGTGMELFRADTKFGGEYPPSYRLADYNIPNPHAPTGGGANNGRWQLGGANLAVYALAGADLLGSAGIRDVNYNDPAPMPQYAGRAPWADDLHAQDNGLYRMNGLQPAYARTSFVDVSRMKFPTREGLEFRLPGNKDSAEPTGMHGLTFLDAFDQPILYYRANIGMPAFCGYGVQGVFNTGIYDMGDNAHFTGLRASKANLPGYDIGAGKGHFSSRDPSTNVFISPATGLLDPTKRDLHKGTFGYTVINPNSGTVLRPHNAETFILLSAGPDGLFGTEDDIANFPTNK